MVQFEQFDIRPMVESDLRMVLQWRNSDRVRKNSMTDEVIDWDRHSVWFKQINSSSTHRYYIVEMLKVPIGVVYFKQINQQEGRWTWGLYVGDDTAPRGSGTAIGYHGLSLAFHQLHIDRIDAEVLSYNVISTHLHERLGFRRDSELDRHEIINSVVKDVIGYSLVAQDWTIHKQKLEQRA